MYANSGTLERIIFTFPYVFNKMAAGGGIPKLNLLAADNHTDEDPIKIGSFEIVPVPMLHGSMIDYGWILRNKNADGEYVSIVYLTDCSQISDRSIELVKAAGGKIEHLVIDALRESPHPTHCNFEQSLGYAERIGAVHTWLTHICHDRTHVEIQKYISENLGKYPGLSEIVRKGGSVEPAYDGLEIEA
ncbi:MAG: hypothetical protein KBT11_01630 [Treponema sp.]|nr:hypothetical protein [Candidatus Treponema equifaecale]